MFTRLRSDIQCILDRDPAARSTWEVITCYPGLHALVLHRAGALAVGPRLRWLGRFISQLSRWFTGIEIHPGAKIGDARVHRPRHGRRDRRDGRNRRRLHDLPGRHAGRHLAVQGRQAPPDAGPQRGGGRRRQGAGRLHRGRRRQDRQQCGGDQAGAGGRHRGGHSRRASSRPKTAARRERGGQPDGFSAYGITRERRPAVAGDEGPDRQRLVARAPDRAAVAGHREAVVDAQGRATACRTMRP